MAQLQPFKADTYGGEWLEQVVEFVTACSRVPAYTMPSSETVIPLIVCAVVKPSSQNLQAYSAPPGTPASSAEPRQPSRYLPMPWQW